MRGSAAVASEPGELHDEGRRHDFVVLAAHLGLDRDCGSAVLVQ